MNAEQNNYPTLLAVLAHPDDETFGMGGTLALYAERGVRTYLVCATRGEVGEMDPQYLHGYNSIAERREHELRCAAGTLGLTGVYFLNYRDSGMPGTPDNQHPQALAAAPLERVAGQVTHYIRLLKPQVVLTFDPIGGYRHPDHIAIHQATVRAFEMAGNPAVLPDDLPPFQPHKLYFHTISRRFLRWMVRLMPLFGQDPQRFGRNQDIDLKAVAIEDFPVHVVVDYRPVRERKIQASHCHASQGGVGMTRGPLGWAMRLGGTQETFMRARPPAPAGLREKDLFEGI